MKHTKGPWIQAGPSFGKETMQYSTSVMTEWGDEDQCYVEICQLPGNCFDEENEANARLIASAPGLLEALKTLVEAGGLGPEGMFNDARAAVAKATGEQQ